jgi:Amidohydrolase/Major Facilitator Superfamily
MDSPNAASRLNDLSVPLYTHPGIPLPDVQQAYYTGFPPEVTAQFSLTRWGWHHEAGIHVLRLILSGTFGKYPGLQVISGHWGEMVPFYLHRLDDMLPPNLTGLSQTITETYLNHVWVTPSGLFDLLHFQFIHTVIGADRIIWSVDYPYLTLDGTREFLGKLPVSEQDREKIAHLNAEKLTLLYQDVDGWTDLRPGLSWLFMNIPFLVMAQFAGRLSRQLPARAIAGGGCLVTAAGILTFSTLTRSSPFIIAVIGYVLFGTGTGMWTPGVANVAMRDVPPGLSGTASGVFNASRQVGTSIGLAILGVIGADPQHPHGQVRPYIYPAQPGGRRSGKPATSPAPASAR